MASSIRFPKAELTGIYGAAVKRMSRRMLGDVPEQTPPTVTDELSARLLDQLGAAALVELTAFIAMANLMTRTNTAFGIESQGYAAACDLKPLAVPSTT